MKIPSTTMSKIIITIAILFLSFFFYTSCSQDNYESEIKQIELPECGFEATAETMAILSDISKKSRGHVKRNSITQVPVSLNIVTVDDGTGGPTNVEILYQFNEMNLLYVDAGIEFVICDDINFINSSELYEANVYDQAVLKDTYNRANVINMYVTGSVEMSTGANVCGYAFYPGGPEVIFLAANCFNNGSTLSHEMGHFFGLIHTHGQTNTPNGTNELADGSNGDSAGDYVQDTPSDPKLSGQVTNGCIYTGDDTDSMGNLHVPDPSNTMSYSLKHCRTYLSPDQLIKIDYVLGTSRSNLVCTGPEPDGTEDNPYIIESPITSSKWYGDSSCDDNAETTYYLVNGDLDLTVKTLSFNGKKSVKITGNVYGDSSSLLKAKGCSEICVVGTISAPTIVEEDGVITESCGAAPPDGSEDNPYIINDLLLSKTYANGNCETNNDIVYYKKEGDLNLSSYQLKMKGQVKLTITGNVYGTNDSKLISKDCAEICVQGTVYVQNRRHKDGTINDGCGVPLGTVNHPIIINDNLTKNMAIRNGDCDTNEIKYFATTGDFNLNDFRFTSRGKCILNVVGNVTGTPYSLLRAKKCGEINVDGNIFVTTLIQSNGTINN
jgi:hypothetical protein